ncbi:hypothetical protein HON01_03885, partial [Candidatus Woesearchaeota archaeon]|nr:hypothetical protein [Candidatus Woesearchaeota archaeon]
ENILIEKRSLLTTNSVELEHILTTAFQSEHSQLFENYSSCLFSDQTLDEQVMYDLFDFTKNFNIIHRAIQDLNCLKEDYDKSGGSVEAELRGYKQEIMDLKYRIEEQKQEQDILLQPVKEESIQDVIDRTEKTTNIKQDIGLLKRDLEGLKSKQEYVKSSYDLFLDKKNKHRDRLTNLDSIGVLSLLDSFNCDYLTQLTDALEDKLKFSIVSYIKNNLITRKEYSFSTALSESSFYVGSIHVCLEINKYIDSTRKGKFKSQYSEGFGYDLVSRTDLFPKTRIKNLMNVFDLPDEKRNLEGAHSTMEMDRTRWHSVEEPIYFAARFENKSKFGEIFFYIKNKLFKAKDESKNDENEESKIKVYVC